MNEQTHYTTKLSGQYKIYTEQPEDLFADLNQLAETAVSFPPSQQHHRDGQSQ